MAGDRQGPSPQSACAAWGELAKHGVTVAGALGQQAAARGDSGSRGCGGCSGAAGAQVRMRQRGAAQAAEPAPTARARHSWQTEREGLCTD